MELGDTVSAALSSVGLTEERVSAWLGQPCNCARRKTQLNAIGKWARLVLSGKIDDAAGVLERMTGTKSVED